MQVDGIDPQTWRPHDRQRPQNLCENEWQRQLKYVKLQPLFEVLFGLLRLQELVEENLSASQKYIAHSCITSKNGAGRGFGCGELFKKNQRSQR